MLPKKGQVGRQHVFDGLLARLQQDASLTPITDITDYAPARMLRHVKPDRNPRRNQGVRVRKQ
jgi:hypothetical protein